MSLGDNLAPYQLSLTKEALNEIVIRNARTANEREWVPQVGEAVIFVHRL